MKGPLAAVNRQDLLGPYTRTHSAAALDEQGKVLAEITVGADPTELDRFVRWVEVIGQKVGGIAAHR